MLKISLSQLLIGAKIIEDINEWVKITTTAFNLEESDLSIVSKEKKISFLDLALIIADKSSLSYLDLDALDKSLIPEDLNVRDLELNRYLSFNKTKESITIITSDPSNVRVENVKFQELVEKVQIYIVEDDKLTKYIKDYIKKYDVGGHSSSIVVEMLEELNPKNEDDTEDSAVQDAPVVKFINGLLLQAVKMKASDIHFEPYEDSYRVRFRVDGNLFEIKRVPVELKNRLASRIKIMSNMDISEKRTAQDGRCKIKMSSNRLIDVRVSSLPTLWGEKIVMRILDAANTALDINKLGLTDKQKELLLNAIKKPYGMILSSGPVGSGKTVSLYTCISLLNKESVNICTAEDPVEINLKGINQVNINERAGLTFDGALVAFLRQDPDIILIGEIRNYQTADTALKASQTGRLIFSTIHANDAPKTITRLIQMGIEPYNIASSILLIMSQRLCKKLCPHCKEKQTISKEVLESLGFRKDDVETYEKEWHIYKAVGCDECLGRGYRGREAVYQILPMTDNIREIILRRGTDSEIENEAKLMGVNDLRYSGLEKVKSGLTSLDEVIALTNYN